MPDRPGSGFELAEILETLSGNCPTPPRKHVYPNAAIALNILKDEE
jgi:hypothetical protein